VCSFARKTFQNVFLFALRKFGSPRMKAVAHQAVTNSLVLKRTMAADIPQLGCAPLPAAKWQKMSKKMAARVCAPALLSFICQNRAPSLPLSFLLLKPPPLPPPFRWMLYSSFIHMGAFLYFIYVTHLQPLADITGSSNRSSQV